jgi:hypothetical protein
MCGDVGAAPKRSDCSGRNERKQKQVGGR